jgi:hypothetical protein
VLPGRGSSLGGVRGGGLGPPGKIRNDPWRRFLFRLCRELGIAAPRLLLEQVTSKEVSEWAAYLHWLDEREAPTPPVSRARARPKAAAGDDLEVSWQRLLSSPTREHLEEHDVSTSRSIQISLFGDKDLRAFNAGAERQKKVFRPRCGPG